MAFVRNNEKKENHKTTAMKKTFLYTVLLLLLTACGGDEEETTEPTVVPGAKETSITKESVTENPMDSTLMREYIQLSKQMKNKDSLLARLDSIAQGNDSLIQLIYSLQDSVDLHLPVKIPNDTTDYNFPPNGNPKKHSYTLFANPIPEKAKELKLIPKDFRGTFANANRAQVIITETDITYKNPKGVKTKVFVIASDQKCVVSEKYVLLQYDTGKGWAVVTLELTSGNLAFRIIPAKAPIEAAPSKKVLKKYLEKNRRELLQVYNRVK